MQHIHFQRLSHMTWCFLGTVSSIHIHLLQVPKPLEFNAPAKVRSPDRLRPAAVPGAVPGLVLSGDTSGSAIGRLTPTLPWSSRRQYLPPISPSSSSSLSSSYPRALLVTRALSYTEAPPDRADSYRALGLATGLTDAAGKDTAAAADGSPGRIPMAPNAALSCLFSSSTMVNLERKLDSCSSMVACSLVCRQSQHSVCATCATRAH